MIIFTSICANYLHKARTLSKSVKDNIPNVTFIVCLLEREINPEWEYECFDKIILAKDAWEGNFDRFIFKHSIVEASTSVKGQFFKYLYSQYENESEFIYLDPDTYVYSDFTELREKLKTRPIVLCPHLLQPGNIDMELSSTAHGVYNLGFLAVNNTEEAKEFIDWWAERLYLFCYDDKARGIFTDQKWIDLAPCFFDVEVFKHRGYDFAPWSLLDCGMKIGDDGEVNIKGDPLRFIHFSGYGAVAESCISKWLPEGEHPFKKLYQEYSEIHDANNQDGISKTKWSYNVYNSGDEISDNVRHIFRSDYELMFKHENPFVFSNDYYLSFGIKKGKFSKFIRVFLKSVVFLRNYGLKAFVEKVKGKLKR